MLTIIFTSCLIAMIFAPLGSIVLWKRYVYFGDGLAHASLLAGSVSVISGVPIFYAGIVVSTLFAISVFKLKNTSGTNAVISLISSSMLALALIIASASKSPMNITSLLFGDIIGSGNLDLIILAVILALVASFLFLCFNSIILIVLNREIALARGIKVRTIELIFLILLSFSVLSTVKIVGTLLVTSILLIPAMAARLISRTPYQMIVFATTIALTANLSGICASFYLDCPIAPVITLINLAIYTVCFAFGKKG